MNTRSVSRRDYLKRIGVTAGALLGAGRPALGISGQPKRANVLFIAFSETLTRQLKPHNFP